jgi:hypothetical protein
MRLRAVERGHRLKEKMLLTLIGMGVRGRAPDVVRTLFYRPELFGRAMHAWTSAVMRGASVWSVAERELFAAFTSKQNQCLF